MSTWLDSSQYSLTLPYTSLLWWSMWTFTLTFAFRPIMLIVNCKKCKRKLICIALTRLYSAQVWHVLMTDHTEMYVSATCHPHVYPQMEWTIPAFNPHLQSVAVLWLVLISCPIEGRRLSWSGWLSEILRWFACLKMVALPGICRDSWELNLRPSSREYTRLPSHCILDW